MYNFDNKRVRKRSKLFQLNPLFSTNLLINKWTMASNKTIQSQVLSKNWDIININKKTDSNQ